MKTKLDSLKIAVVEDLGAKELAERLLLAPTASSTAGR